jgi:hypothetical protein
MHFSSPLVNQWRVALLLVTVMSLTPGRTSAECGDYLTIRNSMHDSHHIQSKPTVDRLALEAFDVSTKREFPCRGPNCSKLPAKEKTPLAPPVIPVSSSVKEVVQFSPHVGVDTGADSCLPVDNAFNFPVHRASSIFHPPRLA